MWARLAMALGGFGALVITPAFALSYFQVYGMPSESPPLCLAALEGPLISLGWLESGSAATYDRLGLIYFGAWSLGLVGFARFMGQRWRESPAAVRRAEVAVLVCLTVVAIGILGDYGPWNDTIGNVGYGLTFLGLMAALPTFAVWGLQLHRQPGGQRLRAWAVGTVGGLSVVSGFLIGQVPAGPGATYAVAALVAAFSPVGRARE